MASQSFQGTFSTSGDSPIFNSSTFPDSTPLKYRLEFEDEHPGNIGSFMTHVSDESQITRIRGLENLSQASAEKTRGKLVKDEKKKQVV